MQEIIALRGYRLPVPIGLHDFERKAPQTIVVDVWLFLDPIKTVSDAPTDLVDYDFLRPGILAIVERGHIELQETLVEEITRLCFQANPRIARVRVRTGKPSVYPDCDLVSYSLDISRNAA